MDTHTRSWEVESGRRRRSTTLEPMSGQVEDLSWTAQEGIVFIRVGV